MGRVGAIGSASSKTAASWGWTAVANRITSDHLTSVAASCNIPILSMREAVFHLGSRQDGRRMLFFLRQTRDDLVFPRPGRTTLSSFLFHETVAAPLSHLFQRLTFSTRPKTTLKTLLGTPSTIVLAVPRDLLPTLSHCLNPSVIFRHIVMLVLPT
jgi:hypothetical protein